MFGLICLFQLYVIAYDSDVPENKARVEVQITVDRNQGIPQFQPAVYNIRLDEFYDLAVSVVNITAVDLVDNVRLQISFNLYKTDN
jgi:hypothetical protein